VDLYLHPHTPSLSSQGILNFLLLQPRHIPEGTDEDHGNLSKNGWGFSRNPKRSPVECRRTKLASCHLNHLAKHNGNNTRRNKPSLLQQKASKSIAGPTLGRDVSFEIILPPTYGLQVASLSDAFDGIPSLHFLQLS
jgi:hypothetical protein